MCAAALMKKDLALPIGMDNSGWENLLVLLWMTRFCINLCYKLCVTAGSKLILCNILSKSFICYFNLFFNLRQWIGGGSWDSWGSLTSGLPSLKFRDILSDSSWSCEISSALFLPWFLFPLTSPRCVSPTQGSWGRVWPCLTPLPSWRPWREICPCTSKPMSTLSLRTSSPVYRTQVEDVWPGKCLWRQPACTALSVSSQF